MPVQKLSSLSGGEPSHAIRQRVEAAHPSSGAFCAIAEAECVGEWGYGPSEVQKSCVLDKESLAMIHMAVERMGLSARAYHPLLKLSRTIDDLAGSEQVLQAHLA